MLLPKFIILTNPDNTDIHVNVSAIVCITKDTVGSKVTMLSNYYMYVRETPIQIQAKF